LRSGGQCREWERSGSIGKRGERFFAVQRRFLRQFFQLQGLGGKKGGPGSRKGTHCGTRRSLSSRELGSFFGGIEVRGGGSIEAPQNEVEEGGTADSNLGRGIL